MQRRYLLILFLLLFSFSVMAEGEISEVYPYTLTADGEISYDNHQGILTAVGNACFVLSDMKVVADRLVVFYKEEVIRAEGDELIFQVGEEVFKGSALEYNYGERTGSILDLTARIRDLSFSGSKISLVDSEKYEMEEVELTPCIFSEPHYSIKAREVTVYPEEKIVAKNLWFYFAGQKILYLPSYTVKYNKGTGNFEDISVFADLGYDSNDGLFVTVTYPYEIGDNLKGEMNGEINQKDDQYFQMNNTYKLTPTLDLVNSYLYKDLIEDDGDIKKSNLLKGGLKYHNYGLNLYTGFSRDFLTEENLIEFDGRYNFNKFSFRYFNEFDKEMRIKELYSIDYRSKYPLQLLYRKGYNTDYLPYLKIDRLNYQLAGVNINSAIGMGKVANKEIISDRIRLDISTIKSFVNTDSLNLTLNGVIQSNYYKPDINLDDNTYNYYKIALNSSYHDNLSENLQLRAELNYDYSWDTGEAYLPEDKRDINEYLKPGIGISFIQAEEMSAWHLDLNGSYELRERELEKLDLRLTREYDCFDYFINIDIIDRGIGVGINF